MKLVSPRMRSMVPAVAVVAGLAAYASTGVARLSAQTGQDNRNAYSVHNLVSDGFISADQTDAQLVNPWGLVFNPTAVAWVADNHTGVSTLYDGLGNKQPLVVTIPPPAGGTGPSAPTGIVFNVGSDFVVSSGALNAPSRFIFATEDGTISAWAPTVDMNNAILEVDNSKTRAVYKGLALAANGTGRFLYATNFRQARIDVFDSSFKPATLPGSFTDPKIPSGYAPFGIQNILGNLYVTYAKQDQDAMDDVPGQGFGFVDVYDANGVLIRQLAQHGQLNAPWGLALAPADFGRFSNDLLVGNFGDGHINAFDLQSGNFRGSLSTGNGDALVIDGLWALVFGNGVLHQPANALFFTAGPDDESHGLYGRIDAAQSTR